MIKTAKDIREIGRGERQFARHRQFTRKQQSA